MKVNLSAVYITLVIGTCLSVGGLLVARQQDERAIANQQQRLTDFVVDQVRQKQEINRQILFDIRSLLATYPDIDVAHFKRFTQDDVTRHAEIMALGWAPLEMDGSVARYTVRMSNPPLLEGLDLMAGEKTRLLLQRAHGSDVPVVAPNILPGQSPTSVLAMLSLSGAAGDSGSATVSQGYVVALFDLASLFREAIAPLGERLSGVDLGVYDAGTEGGPRQLYGAEVSGSKRWRQQRTLEVGGRRWLIASVVTPAYVARHRTWMPYVVFVLGMLLTLALTFHLRSLQQRSREVERVVEQRTRELRESEERNRIIVSEAADAVITIDGSGSIQSFNAAAERMFGYSEAEVMGCNVNRLMPEPYHSAHDGYLRHYRESGDRQIIGIGRDVVAQRRDGDTFPVHLSVGEGRVDGEEIFIGVLNDISQRKAAEQALLRAKEEAEAANRQKSAFLNMMSHELRTPLTVVLGYLPLLADRNRMPAPEVIEGIVADMNVSGEHLLHLINDLLDISKMEAGQLALHIEEVAADKLVDGIVREFSHKAAGLGIVLHAELPPFSLLVDPRRFHQIMTNLVGNALKFTREGEVLIRGGRNDSLAWFEVIDTGVGIPEDHLATIFEPFRQVDSSSTRKTGGTGLGLAITRRLVELHGGRIEVASEKGRTVFKFTISQEPGGEDGEDTAG